MQKQIPNELYIEQQDYYGLPMNKPIVPEGEVWVFTEREGHSALPTVVWGNGTSQGVPNPPLVKQLKKTIYRFRGYAEYPYVVRLFKESNLWLEFKTSIAVTLSDPVAYMEAQLNRATFKRKTTREVLEAPLHVSFQAFLSFDSPLDVSPLAPRDLQPALLDTLLSLRDISKYVQQGFQNFAEIGVTVRVRVHNATSSPIYQQIFHSVLNSTQEHVSQLHLFLTNNLSFLNESKGVLAFYEQVYTLIAERYDFIFQKFRPVIEHYAVAAYRGSDQLPNPTIISMLFKDIISQQISALLIKRAKGPNDSEKRQAIDALAGEKLEPISEQRVIISQYPTQRLVRSVQPDSTRHDITKQGTAHIDDAVEPKQQSLSASSTQAVPAPETLLRAEEANNIGYKDSVAPSRNLPEEEKIDREPKLKELPQAKLQEDSKPILQPHSTTDLLAPELKEATPKNLPTLIEASKGNEQLEPALSETSLHQSPPSQAIEALNEELVKPQLVQSSPAPVPSVPASKEPASHDDYETKEEQKPSRPQPQGKGQNNPGIKEPRRQKPTLSAQSPLIGRSSILPSPQLGNRARVIRNVQLSALYRAQSLERWEIFPPYDKVGEVVYVHIGNGITVQIDIPEKYPDELPVIQVTHNSQKIRQRYINEIIDPLLAGQDYNLHLLVQKIARNLPLYVDEVSTSPT